MPDCVELAKTLIAAESVTPARGAVFDVVEAALLPSGFAVERFITGGVENLLAVRGSGGRHFAFAGHLDVVPPGAGWSNDPFTPTVRGDLLYGRGAVDMKGAVAAFIAAAARVENRGTLSLILTGDEEGPPEHGTVALIESMAEPGLKPDLCLVGEPTSAARLGDTIKIGRRGSINLRIEVPGKQGHVAYPQLADNPIPKLLAALTEIEAMMLDRGNRWFQPSNLEITDITVGNAVTNIIPGHASARLNIRFNNEQRGPAFDRRIREIVHRHAPEAQVVSTISGEAFLTEPGPFSALVSEAIAARQGICPELSTSGGTSDARFLVKLCPVIEFGLVNATMHQLDEAVALPDLRALTDIYADIARRALA